MSAIVNSQNVTFAKGGANDFSGIYQTPVGTSAMEGIKIQHSMGGTVNVQMLSGENIVNCGQLVSTSLEDGNAIISQGRVASTPNTAYYFAINDHNIQAITAPASAGGTMTIVGASDYEFDNQLITINSTDQLFVQSGCFYKLVAAKTDSDWNWMMTDSGTYWYPAS